MSCCFTLSAHSSSQFLYYCIFSMKSKEPQTVYCAYSRCSSSFQLFGLCVCFSRVRRTSWRSQTLMTSASTVPLCFLIPRGPPPRKRPDVGGKKGKVCLRSTLAMLCGVSPPSKSQQKPSESDCLVWIWVAKLKFIFLSFIYFGNVFSRHIALTISL